MADRVELTIPITPELVGEIVRQLQMSPGVRPKLLSRARAAEFLGINTETLRKLNTIKPVFLEGCAKPLYRMADLEAAAEFASPGKM